jgi:hypothetical protein
MGRDWKARSREESAGIEMVVLCSIINLSLSYQLTSASRYESIQALPPETDSILH